MHPEQERALAYLARKGTSARVEVLCSELRGAFHSLEERFSLVGTEQRERRPSEGRWSAHEILDHLVVSHEPAIEQLAALVRGETPEGVAIPAGLQTPASRLDTWEQLISRLQSMHVHLITLVESASEDTPLSGRALVEMVVKVPGADGELTPVHWLEPLDWKAFAQAIRVHSLEHRHQLERVLAVAG